MENKTEVAGGITLTAILAGLTGALPFLAAWLLSWISFAAIFAGFSLASLGTWLRGNDARHNAAALLVIASIIVALVGLVKAWTHLHWIGQSIAVGFLVFIVAVNLKK